MSKTKTVKTMQVEQPESIVVDEGQETERKFGLRDLIRFLIDTQPQFNNDGPGIRASWRIEREILDDTKDEGAPFQFQDRDLKLLCDAAEKPRTGMDRLGQQIPAYPIRPARRLHPFVNALQSATVVEVDDKAEAAPDKPSEPTPTPIGPAN